MSTQTEIVKRLRGGFLCKKMCFKKKKMKNS
jgi:hypothetical protein